MQMVMVSQRSNNQAEVKAWFIIEESICSDSISFCVWHDERIIVSVQRLTKRKIVRIFNETKRNDLTAFVLSHCPHKPTEFLLVCF